MANSDISIGFQAQGATDLARQFSAIRKQIQSVEAPLVGATNKFKAFEKASLTTGGAFRNIRAPIQNAAFQIQDIAVQLTMGTNSALVLAQQLPQLVSGFGAVGAVIGGVVAVGAGLAMAFQKGAKQAQTIRQNIESLEQTTSTLESTMRLATGSVEDLRKKFGEAAEDVRQLNIETLKLQTQDAMDAFNASISETPKILSRLSAPIRDVGNQLKVLDMGQSERFLNQRMQAIQKELGLTGEAAGEQAKILEREFTKVLMAFKSEDVKSIQSSMTGLKNTLAELGIPITSLPPEIRQIVIALNEQATAQARLNKVIKDSKGFDIIVPDKVHPMVKAFEDQAEAIRRARDPLYAYLQDLEDLSFFADKLSKEDFKLLEEQLAKTFEEATKSVKPMQEEIEKLSLGIAEGLGKSLASIVTGSETAEQAMKKFVARAIQDLIKLALKMDEVNNKQISVVNGGGGGGNIISTIVKGISSLAGSFSGGMTDDQAMIGGKRAKGGPVMGGKTYLVGEKGPELFTAPKSGQIVPNNQLGGGDTVVNQTFQISTGVAQTVRAELVSLLPSIKEQTVAAVANQKTRGGARGSRL